MSEPVVEAAYTVKVQWLPRRMWLVDRITRWRRAHRNREFSLDGLDLIEPAGDGVLGWIVTVVLGLVLVLVLWFIAIPLLLVIVDWLVLGLILVVGVAVRVLLRRPWEIVIRQGEREVASVPVVGWRAAGRARDAMAAALDDGASPEAVAGVGRQA